MHNFFNSNGLPVCDITFDHLEATPLIINIGRQLGSGGRAIGRRLADALNLDYFDKEILDMAARESGFCTEIFETLDVFFCCDVCFVCNCNLWTLGQFF